MKAEDTQKIMESMEYADAQGNMENEGVAVNMEREAQNREDTGVELSLEDAFAKLEETVADLERDDISLEESFAVYQKGMELLKKCNQAIDHIEKKVLVLEEDGETHEF